MEMTYLKMVFILRRGLGYYTMIQSNMVFISKSAFCATRCTKVITENIAGVDDEKMLRQNKEHFLRFKWRRRNGTGHEMQIIHKSHSIIKCNTF